MKEQLTEVKQHHRNLPEYLGFGTLDPQSVMARGGALVAQYRRDGELVYQVEIAGDGTCMLLEVAGGRTIMESTGKSLKDAFMLHFLALTRQGAGLRNHPHFAALSRQIITSGNIYFQYPAPHMSSMLFFPAGLIYTLRLPVIERNRDAWLRLKQQRAPDGPIDAITEQRGVILRFLPAQGTVIVEEVLLAECHVLLLNVVAAARVISQQTGLILPEKEYRLIVCDSSDALPGVLATHPGVPELGFSAFAVFPLGRATSPSTEVVTMFENTARRMTV